MPATAITSATDPLWPFGFKAAVFDFDGTVADSHHVWRRVDDIFFGRRGLVYSEKFAETLSILGFEEGARYTIDEYGLSDSVEDVCREWNELGRELYKTEVSLRPGAREYVEALHRLAIPVGLATTNAPEVVDAMEARLPLGSLFPVRTYECELPGKTKEHPDIYLECARRLGAEPRDCVVFEDLAMGIRSAKEAGMTAVGVLTGLPQQNVEAIMRTADYVIRDWAEWAKG